MADELLTKALHAWLREQASQLPVPGKGSDGLVTAALVHRLAGEAASPMADDDAAALERLCKKIEVTRRLASVYSLDFAGTVDRTPVSAPVAIALCGIYLAAALKRRDLKWLNTSLKMLDGCLGQPKAAYPRCLRQWAGQVLVNWPWSDAGDVGDAAGD